MRKLCTLLIFLSFGLSTIFAQSEMELLATWSDPTLPPGTQYNNTYNEVWGFVNNGHEYAVIGSTMGTHILDVTDTDNVFERQFIEGASAGGHIVHRDYHDFRGYLYAVADESGGGTVSTLQIIDISGLPDNDAITVYDDDDLIRETHNIFIDTTTAKLYALAAKGGDSGYKAMKIYSLDDPVDPVKIGQYGVIGGEGFGHVHDAFVDNDKAFLNCGGDGLFIVDFSGDDPELLARYTTNDYPESGYNHSGWPTPDLSHYYFADETWGTAMKVVNVNDFTEIELSNTLFNAGNEDDNSIAHNQVVHCGKLYVSYYYDGLQVYDLADPENPVREAYYSTSQIPVRENYEGAWGVYPFLPSGNIIVSDMQEGFFLLKGITDNCSTPVATKEEILELAVAIYPNPTSGDFTIKFDGKIEQLDITNLQGESVKGMFSFDGNVVRTDADLSSGIYLVHIQTRFASTTKRIIIVGE